MASYWVPDLTAYWISPRALRAAAVALALLAALPGAAALDLTGEPIEPLPINLQLDPRKVLLGRQLFRDTRFAQDNAVACISCHLPTHGGADPRPRSIGTWGRVVPINAPSIRNAALNFRQLWSGAVGSVEEVVDRVVTSPHIFGSDWETVVAKLASDAKLEQSFGSAYGNGITAGNIKDALGVYLKSLAAPSRFDRYLRGDAAAISAEERRGYEGFKKYGCVACHQGVNVGGNMYQRFGAMADYFTDRVTAGKGITAADLGRFSVTGKEADRNVFKVPSLRNVALTAPYFHDASAKTLEEAVDVMFKYQLGRSAPATDKALIVKFLRTLNAEFKDEP